MSSKRPPRRLLLVNFHYVRDPEQYHYPGIHPISVQRLREQVALLQSRVRVVSPADVEAYYCGEGDLPTRGALLTFDDGLIDHADVAKQVLDPAGIHAAFFVNSRPLKEGRPLVVHKLHYLRATTPPDVFQRRFLAELPSPWDSEQPDARSVAVARDTYVYDTPEVAWLKYLVNFRLPYDLVDEVTGRLLEAEGMSSKDFCDRTYLSTEQLRTLAERGHEIGAHGHTHRPFQDLNDDELADEMAMNLDALDGVTGTSVDWVSYPYGSTAAVPDDPDAFCHRHGFRIGLTMLRGWNTGRESPAALRRINTNELEQSIRPSALPVDRSTEP